MLFKCDSVSIGMWFVYWRESYFCWKVCLVSVSARTFCSKRDMLLQIWDLMFTRFKWELPERPFVSWERPRRPPCRMFRIGLTQFLQRIGRIYI